MKRLIIIISLFNFYIVTAMAVTKADADSSYVNENYQQAISQYEELIEEGAANADIFYNLGNVHSCCRLEMMISVSTCSWLVARLLTRLCHSQSSSWLHGISL